MRDHYPSRKAVSHGKTPPFIRPARGRTSNSIRCSQLKISSGTIYIHDGWPRHFHMISSLCTGSAEEFLHSKVLPRQNQCSQMFEQAMTLCKIWNVNDSFRSHVINVKVPQQATIEIRPRQSTNSLRLLVCSMPWIRAEAVGAVVEAVSDKADNKNTFIFGWQLPRCRVVIPHFDYRLL